MREHHRRLLPAPGAGSALRGLRISDVRPAARHALVLLAIMGSGDGRRHPVHGDHAPGARGAADLLARRGGQGRDRLDRVAGQGMDDAAVQPGQRLRTEAPARDVHPHGQRLRPDRFGRPAVRGGQLHHVDAGRTGRRARPGGEVHADGHQRRRGHVKEVRDGHDIHRFGVGQQRRVQRPDGGRLLGQIPAEAGGRRVPQGRWTAGVLPPVREP